MPDYALCPNKLGVRTIPRVLTRRNRLRLRTCELANLRAADSHVGLRIALGAMVARHETGHIARGRSHRRGHATRPLRDRSFLVRALKRSSRNRTRNRRGIAGSTRASSTRRRGGARGGRVVRDAHHRSPRRLRPHRRRFSGEVEVLRARERLPRNQQIAGLRGLPAADVAMITPVRGVASQRSVASQRPFCGETSGRPFWRPRGRRAVSERNQLGCGGSGVQELPVLQRKVARVVSESIPLRRPVRRGGPGHCGSRDGSLRRLAAGCLPVLADAALSRRSLSRRKYFSV